MFVKLTLITPFSFFQKEHFVGGNMHGWGVRLGPFQGITRKFLFSPVVLEIEAKKQ